MSGVIEHEAKGFLKVLSDFNIIGFALGVLMAKAGADLVNGVIEGIIMPTINPLIEKFYPENKKSVTLGRIEIHLKKTIEAFIRFFALSLIVYLLMKTGIKMTKPITWVSVRSVAPGVTL